MFALGILVLADCRLAAADVPVAADSNLTRIGIAPGTWSGVNRNDAASAITAWAQTIMRSRGFELKVETTVFDTFDDITTALREGKVDAVSMLTDQFLAMDPELRPPTVYCSVKGGSFTERYVLVARHDGGVNELAGLRDRKLALQSNSRASMALPWLESLLDGASLGPASETLKAVTRLPSPSKAILQVYFRQADAALVTADALKTAIELNPQLDRELRVLATSPEVIPALFFFRRDYASATRDALEPAILTVQETAAGRQVLTVFQADRMIEQPVSALDNTRKLLVAGGGGTRGPAAK